ncbi:hypothetical protein [Solitalea canadensis]|uniref:Uncharacterized protein n=1 Tax=Solitalea canadensis (strain ATCC 29591 / DSM 3403 / JCM 21819 / LMG 8368 / NBRC 15130 / NCIMB 12057 / USAM 9D) TaxID=929556 RepID=H8KPF3_SOLCM|nr:hypothetical protein [Solitalea canadensis]AFD05851.1 hypothetical protein Solca_0727 [Solitalea canadensis DSM 3403]
MSVKINHEHHSSLYWLVMIFTGLFILGIAIKILSFFFNANEGIGLAINNIGWYLFLPGAVGLLIMMLIHAIFRKNYE